MSVGPITPPSAGGLGGVAGATGSPQPGATPTAAPVAAPPAAVPTAAVASGLAALIGEDLATQDSLAPLLADLTAALQSGGVLAPARATAQQILNLQVPLDGAVTVESLRSGVARSGLFLEAGLAAAAQAQGDPGVASLVGADLKALLLRLPIDLASQSEAAAELAPPAALGVSDLSARRPTTTRPPPPVAGGPTSGQTPAAPSIGPDMDAGSQRQALTHETHAALARLELMQLASTAKPGATPRWVFELPVASPQGPGMAQFEVSPRCATVCRRRRPGVRVESAIFVESRGDRPGPCRGRAARWAHPRNPVG